MRDPSDVAIIMILPEGIEIEAVHLSSTGDVEEFYPQEHELDRTLEWATTYSEGYWTEDGTRRGQVRVTIPYRPEVSRWWKVSWSDQRGTVICNAYHADLSVLLEWWHRQGRSLIIEDRPGA
jgi:hypothetical protein